MPDLSPRFGMVVVPAALTLAACGSTAINANYTPGPKVISEASPSVSSQPSKTVTTKAAKPHHAAHPTASPTHASGSKHATMPTSAPPMPKPPSSSGGTHHVTSTAATITVTPSTGLNSGDTVTIHGTHFNPKIQVIAVECIDNGNSTQASNCNINLLSMPAGFYPAANGTFTATLKVYKSFGGNTCSSSTPCLVSVTQPNPNPSEEADAPIRFR